MTPPNGPNRPALLSDRLPYDAIVDRPALAGPDGARLLVWVIVNVEHWSIERAMPRTVLSPPMGQPLLPDLPTVAESGYPGYEATAWGGISGPKGLPPPVVDKLHAAIVKVLNGPFRQKQEALGGTILGTTPAQFTAHFRSEIERWHQVITTAGIKAD